MLLGMDGADGHGKSTLARNLAERLHGIVIHVDEYLERDKKTYVEHVDVASLQRAIDEAGRQHSLVIVEGVCLGAVMERMQVEPDAVIFVQKLGQRGLLSDHHLFDGRDVDKHVADMNRALAAWKGGRVPAFAIEVMRYIHDREPHRTAQVLYRWRKPSLVPAFEP